MIKSVNKVKTNLVNSSEEHYVYAKSKIAREDEGFMVTTTYTYKDDNNFEHILSVFREPYTVEEIAGLYAALEPLIGDLPYVEMTDMGTELALFDYLNQNNKFGIAPNSNGWEIIA